MLSGGQLRTPEYYRQIYQRFSQAALLRAGASLIMWLFALAAYLMDIIAPHHFMGVSLAVFYLVAINPPTLWILKGIRSSRRFARFAIFINLLEIIGYTAVIYSLGGIEATYLTIIYAALIAHVGAMSERRHTFLITGACIAVYITMVLLEGADIIPWFKTIPDFHLPWPHRLARMFVVAGLLLVIAFIASHTATLRRKTRSALRNSQRDLELRVTERTAELKRANEELQLEMQERVSAERSLKNSHETFLTVLDSIDATIYVADLKTHEILFMNQRMKDTFGRDFTGSRCWEVFRGATAPCPHCTMGRLLDENGDPTGVHMWEDENPLTQCWYINYDRAIKWIDGRWVFLQIAIDITQLKTLEKERLEAEAQLHRAQKMEALGMLAGGVAHDLNNILSGIVSFPQLLLMDLPPESPLREPIDVIRKSGEKAAAIVQDLLNLARRGLPVTEILNLSDLVQDYLNSLEYDNLMRQYPGCRLEADCAPDLMNIMGTPSQLSKVVMNLVTNAFEAMPEGEGHNFRPQIIISTEP